MTSRKTLGRGFDALLSPGKNSKKDPSTAEETELSVDLIRINQNQPRKSFDEQKLQELAQSIRNHGVIQPVIIRKIADQNGFELVVGERRFRASVLADLKKIPVIIRKINDDELPEISLLENIQRENLTPIEEAEAYSKLMKLKNYTQEILAKKLGKSRPNVANTLRLLQLPKEIQKSVSSGEIASGHGRALLSVANPAEQSALKRKIIEEGLSVREIEKRIKTGQQQKHPVKKNRQVSYQENTHLHYAQNQLSESLATKIKIIGNKDTGKIEIFYSSQEDFNRIYESLNPKNHE